MENLQNIHREMIYRFEQDSKSIAEFIIGRYIEHRKCYELAGFMFKILRNLFANRILKEDLIDETFLAMCGAYEEMIDTEPLLALQYFDYIRELLNYYRMESLENELYEVAENLTKFLKIYTKIKVNI